MLVENINATENREQSVADGSLPTHVLCSLAFRKILIVLPNTLDDGIININYNLQQWISGGFLWKPYLEIRNAEFYRRFY